MKNKQKELPKIAKKLKKQFNAEAILINFSKENALMELYSYSDSPVSQLNLMLNTLLYTTEKVQKIISCNNFPLKTEQAVDKLFEALVDVREAFDAKLED